MAGRRSGGTARKKAPAISKTTLRIQKDLHKRLKIRAIEEERDMQELAAEALEQYLSSPGKARRAEK